MPNFLFGSGQLISIMRNDTIEFDLERRKI